jgi:hypothetical protein
MVDKLLSHQMIRSMAKSQPTTAYHHCAHMDKNTMDRSINSDQASRCAFNRSGASLPPAHPSTPEPIARGLRRPTRSGAVSPRLQRATRPGRPRLLNSYRHGMVPTKRHGPGETPATWLCRAVRVGGGKETPRAARAAIDGLTRDVDEECQRYPLPTPDRVIYYGITRPSKHARIRCCLLLPRS